MKLLMQRFSFNPDSTGAKLFVNGEPFGYTCEDQKQEIKVMKETCIPVGTYEIKFRDAGGMNKNYAAKYPEHVGMLHLQDVPDFEWVYMHIGNDDDDTEGCPLVGASFSMVKGEFFVYKSKQHYLKLYNLIKLAILENNEKVFLTIEEV